MFANVLQLYELLPFTEIVKSKPKVETFAQHSDTVHHYRYIFSFSGRIIY